MINNWLYTVNPYDEEVDMLINKHIGQDSIDGDGIIGSIFENEISELDKMGKKIINIYINSHGGSVDDGFSIFNSIMRCKTPTCTYVSGLAASIAGVIFQAGKIRKMYDYSILMIHNPARHNEENKGLDPILKIYKDSLITLLSSQNRLSRNQISEIMNAETWLNADTAVNKGFADEIIKVQEVFSGELEGIYELEDEEMRNETNILYNWKNINISELILLFCVCSCSTILLYSFIIMV